MTPFSIAFSYGISYQDYMLMNDNEINEAILGAQYRESREMQLPRIIAWFVGKYINAIKSSSIQKWFPLPFDSKPKSGRMTPEQKAAQNERFRLRDLEKAKRANK